MAEMTTILDGDASSIDDVITPTDDVTLSKLPAPGVPLHLYIIVSVLMVEVLLILIFNTFTLVAVAKTPQLRKTSTNILIGGTCLSDILYGLGGLMFQINFFVNVGHSPALRTMNLIHRISVTVGAVSMIISLYIILLLGVDRTVATLRPHRYKTLMTRRKAAIMITLVWVYVCATVPALAIKKYTTLTDQQKDQIMIFVDEVFPDQMYDWVIVGQMYGVMLACIGIYMVILLAIIRQSKVKVTTMNPPAGGTEFLKNKEVRQVTRTWFLVLALILVSYVPFVIANLMPKAQPWEPGFLAKDLMNGVSSVTIAFYSYMNVFVYAWSHREYRAAFFKLLPGRAPNTQPTRDPNNRSSSTRKTHSTIM